MFRRDYPVLSSYFANRAKRARRSDDRERFSRLADTYRLMASAESRQLSSQAADQKEPIPAQLQRRA